MSNDKKKRNEKKIFGGRILSDHHPEILSPVIIHYPKEK